MTLPFLRGSPEPPPLCQCLNCDVNDVSTFRVYELMNDCPSLLFSCSRIMKLLKEGYKMSYTNEDIGCYDPLDKGIFQDVDGKVQVQNAPELCHQRHENSSNIFQDLFTHTLILKHSKYPLKVEEFTFARIRSCISLSPEGYSTHGFYVSDNNEIVFLKVKPKKSILSGWYINLKTNTVKDVTINMKFINLDMCAVYLKGGSLWIVQNAEVGAINVVVAFMNEDVVRTLNRDFGTMDYWNPNGKEKVTANEIHHEFLHVTISSSRTKIIRKYIQTLKNGFLIPLNNRLIVLTHFYQNNTILIDFQLKVGTKISPMRSLKHDCVFETRFFDSVTSEEKQIVAVRINQNLLLIIDLINCNIIEEINLSHHFDTLNEISFQFSRSGKSLCILGKSEEQNRMFRRFYVQFPVTLRSIALRQIREIFSIDELKMSVLPRTLRSELTFNRLAVPISTTV